MDCSVILAWISGTIKLFAILDANYSNNSILAKEKSSWNLNGDSACIIEASLSEPHTNCYYEKIAIVMYVCVCVCPRYVVHVLYSCTYARVYVRTCGSEDMFHDEIVQEIQEQLGPSYNSLSL